MDENHCRRSEENVKYNFLLFCQSDQTESVVVSQSKKKLSHNE